MPVALSSAVTAEGGEVGVCSAGLWILLGSIDVRDGADSGVFTPVAVEDMAPF